LRLLVARIVLILWLAFSVDNQDDYYGVMSSIRRLNECKKIVTI